MNASELHASFQRLITRQRIGSLATLSDHGWPYVSMTPFSVDTSSGRFVIHVSELGAHTRYLLKRPQASFMICTGETPGEPVHALPRVSFQVEARDLARDGNAWKAARESYLARFPDVGFMMDFKDFHLFHLEVVRVRQVDGFGAARTLPVDDVRRWLGEGPMPDPADRHLESHDARKKGAQRPSSGKCVTRNYRSH